MSTAPAETLTIADVLAADLGGGRHLPNRDEFAGTSVFADATATSDPRTGIATRLLHECISPEGRAVRIEALVGEAKAAGLDINRMVYPTGVGMGDIEGVVCMSLVPMVATLSPRTKHAGAAIRTLVRSGLDLSSQFLTLADGKQLPFYQYAVLSGYPLVDIPASRSDRLFADILSPSYPVMGQKPHPVAFPNALRTAIFDRWYRKHATPPKLVSGITGAGPGRVASLLITEERDLLEAGESMGGEWESLAKDCVQSLSSSRRPVPAGTVDMGEPADLRIPFDSAQTILADPRHLLAARYGAAHGTRQSANPLQAAKRNPNLAPYIMKFAFPASADAGVAVQIGADILLSPSTAKNAWSKAEKTIRKIWLPGQKDVLSLGDGTAPLAGDEMVMVAAMSGSDTLARPKPGESRYSRRDELADGDRQRETAALERIMDYLHPDWRTGISSTGRPYRDLIPVVIAHYPYTARETEMLHWAVEVPGSELSKGIRKLVASISKACWHSGWDGIKERLQSVRDSSPSVAEPPHRNPGDNASASPRRSPSGPGKKGH